MNIYKKYFGFVAIVGRSNVGKSTLLNKLLGRKISITSHKVQTTRYRIFGVYKEDNYQIIYIDTPGVFTRKNSTINQSMNKITNSVINDVELVIFVVESICWTKDDETALRTLQKRKSSVILVINKIDNLQKKSKLLPYLYFLSNKMNFLEIVPISAEMNTNLNVLKRIIYKYLPESNYSLLESDVNYHSKHFIASEIIREKLIRFLGEELPYSISVRIENFFFKNYCYNIHGVIFVERKGQKKIVIGKKGSKIKKIGIEARKDMKKIFETPVYLELWVKIKSDWES